MLDHKNEADMRPYFERAFAKRPEYELYNLKEDPYQFVNLAGNKKYAKRLKEMKKALMEWMENTDDPRAVSDTDIWDTYPYYGKGGVANGKGNAKKTERMKKANNKNRKRRNHKINQEEVL